MHVGKMVDGATKQGDRVVPISDAADYAGLHHSTLRRHVARGTLTEHRKGPKLLFIDLNEIDELYTIRRAS